MADDGKLNVINAALGHLGQEPVDSLDEDELDGSNAARKLLRLIDMARDTVLSRTGWLDALEYVTLQPAVIAGYSNFKYPNVFLLPADALRVWAIDNPDWPEAACWPGADGGFSALARERWEAGTIDNDDGARKIIRATWSLALNVAYVRRASYAAMGAHLADAVAIELAARGAGPVLGDKSEAARLREMANAMVLLAISTDATQEGGQTPLSLSTFAMLRRNSA